MNEKLKLLMSVSKFKESRYVGRNTDKDLKCNACEEKIALYPLDTPVPSLSGYLEISAGDVFSAVNDYTICICHECEEEEKEVLSNYRNNK